ncbi:EpsG family protein, partial [Acinetobacter seifertii]
VIASLFHRSAVICLLIYYAYNLNISKKNMLLIFIASMFLGLFLFKFKVSNLNIPFLSGLELFSAYQEKLDAYNDIGQVSYGQVDSTLSNFLGYLRKAIFVIPMILLVKKDNKIIYGLMNISLIGSVIYFVLGAIASDFKRLGGYFDIFDIILVPAILYGIESKKVRYFLIFIYALFMLLRLYASIYNFWDIYDPFITIFDFHSTRNLY